MRWFVLLVFLGGCRARPPAYPETPEQAAARAAEDQERQERRWRRRQAAAAALRGMGSAFRDAGTSQPAPPLYRCHTDYVGGLICDPQ